jgi:hypothetical protein
MHRYRCSTSGVPTTNRGEENITSFGKKAYLHAIVIMENGKSSRLIGDSFA